MLKKCYRAYVYHCIIKDEDKFSITFGAEYMNSFWERTLDWLEFFKDSIHRFYLVHVTPNDDKTFKKYELIHYGASRPIHIKIAKTPNETILEGFLKENGFVIEDEKLTSLSTVYYVEKEDD